MIAIGTKVRHKTYDVTGIVRKIPEMYQGILHGSGMMWIVWDVGFKNEHEDTIVHGTYKPEDLEVL